MYEPTNAAQKNRHVAEDYLEKYALFLGAKLEARVQVGRLPQTGLLDNEEIGCVTIDNISELNKGFIVNIVPKRNNGSYFFDFIVYAPGNEEDRFVPENGKVHIDFGNEMRKEMYDILRGTDGMEDLTLRPLNQIPGKRGEEARRDRLGQVHKRYFDNQQRIWMYYASNFGGSPAFIVHVPEDPYSSRIRVVEWIESFKKLCMQQRV